MQARVTAEPDMFAEDDIFAATPTDVKEKEAAAAAAAQVGRWVGGHTMRGAR